MTEPKMSLEYPMQAVTLVFVLAVTFAGMLLWTKWKKRNKGKKG
ncbi:hypothetical protein [Gorillibacterium sp. sgz5001074]